MPATTPTLKIPYPLDSDPLRAFPQVAKDAANILDSASTIKTATLPLFDGAWRYDPEGGLVRTINGTNHLNISLVRTGGSFHMEAGGIIDIFRINNTVKVPSTREWVMVGTLFGPGIWPMPIFLNAGLVRVYCYGPVDIQNNGAYRGSAVWVA